MVGEYKLKVVHKNIEMQNFYYTFLYIELQFILLALYFMLRLFRFFFIFKEELKY